MKKMLIIVALFLAACSGAPALTASQVIDQFNAAGIAVGATQPGTRTEGSPLPNTYREHVTFADGQMFVCDDKPKCDTLYVYFDALKGLGGPYYYQSPNGRVVLQLSSSTPADKAAQYAAAVKKLP